MRVSWIRLLRVVCVAIKCITSVKELTDVSTNAVVKEKSATWMLRCIFAHVQDQVVKDDELLIVLNSEFELLFGDNPEVLIIFKGVFSYIHHPIYDFIDSKDCNEKAYIEVTKPIDTVSMKIGVKDNPKGLYNVREHKHKVRSELVSYSKPFDRVSAPLCILLGQVRNYTTNRHK